MKSQEFNTLVESFMKPKTKLKEDNNSISLASLFSLIEEVENAKDLIKEVEQQIPQFIPSQEDVLSKEAIQKFSNLVETDKVENPDREQFDKLIKLQLDSIIGSELDPLSKFTKFVEYLESLKTGKVVEEDLGKVFAVIIFTTSIFSMIKQFNSSPSAAGFLYERFIAYFFGGKMPAGTSIQDVEVNGEFWSLKLKSEAEINGSIENMDKFFDANPTSDIKYLISQKGKYLTTIANYVVSLNKDQFNEILNKKGQRQEYEKTKLAQERNKEIEKSIKDLEKSLKNQETSLTPQDLESARAELERQKVYQKPTGLQFRFSLTDLQPYLITKSPILLSITSDDVTNIMEKNTSIFNIKINAILNEVNRVADKVNNYLLTGKKEIGNDALDSVENLGINLNDLVNPD